LRINFDHIGSCPIDSDIIDESGQIMLDFYSQADIFHELGRITKAKIEKSRIFFAESLNVNTNELFFQYDTITQTKQLIDYCILNLDIKHIITSVFEDKAVLNHLKVLEKNKRINLSYLKTDTFGKIDFKNFEDTLQTDAKTLLSLSHVNKYNGMLLPVKDFINSCKANKVLFHLNISSTIGKYNIDIQQIKTDFISFDFSEQYGNKNTGIFFLKQSIAIADEAYHKLKNNLSESENINAPSIIAIARAFYNSLNNLEKNKEQIKGIRKYLILQLDKHFNLKHIIAPYNKEGIYTIISYYFPEKLFGKYIAEKLDINGISAAKISYPFKLNDEKGEYLRFSIGKANTKEHVDILINILDKLANNEYI
jgi:cysteine desulfurase